MSFESLLKATNKIIFKEGKSKPIFLSGRIRLARNLADQPFPGWAKEVKRKDILSRCHALLTQMPALKGGYFFAMDQLTDLQKQIFVERHWISKELSQSKPGAGVILSKDASFVVMINEEDHLRIQLLTGPSALKKTWKTIDSLDDAIEHELGYAFAADLGYLTACPTNVGTGMRASAMLHLPGLVLSGQMEKVVRAVNQLGIAVRGLFGEGSDAIGSIFQISNQQTLGESEDKIFKKISSVVDTIIEQEQNIRLKLVEQDAVHLFDKLGRAYGILKNSFIISAGEALTLLSLMRLAIDLGMLPEEERGLIDYLFMQSQPAHIQLAAQEAADSQLCERYRAQLLRKHFQVLAPLNFQALTHA